MITLAVIMSGITVLAVIGSLAIRSENRAKDVDLSRRDARRPISAH